MNLFRKISDKIKVIRAIKKYKRIEAIEGYIYTSPVGLDRDSIQIIAGYLTSKKEEITTNIVILLLKNEGLKFKHMAPTLKDETQCSASES